MTRRAVHLRLGGAVQGVGFRPWLARLADRHGVAGWVRNTAGGVEVWAEGPAGQVAVLLDDLNAPPPGAVVEVIDREDDLPVGCRGFAIAPSDPGAELAVRVPPDRGLCADCVRELQCPADRRHHYPFTTCAACGPRFTVVASLPYDRERLTLRRFPMCGACRAEYADPADRRFHVVGIVCGDCGPRVELWNAAGSPTASGNAAVRAAIDRLRAGDILAVKGLGGFQLLARADRPETVARLREVKTRKTKPFAVMLANADGLRELISAREHEVLRSPENPIVLLNVPPGRIGACREVAPGLATVGVMLPTTPLHQLFLDGLNLPLIATSGNRGDEPLVADEAAAPRALAGLADGYLVHDRPIVHRADDSVVRVIDGGAVALRLARGYAPLPLPALEQVTDGPPLLAVGGHQKAAVALWTGRQAVLGPHVGDLDSAATRTAFRETIDHLTRLYGAAPAAVACDLHPEYASTLWAEESGLPVERVQHHHAHAAAVLVEHDRLGDEVLALTWDGTGFGPDSMVWGGEVLLARADDYRRVASLWPFPLPGGEAAVRDPRRTAFGLMTTVHGLGPTVDDPDLLRHLGIAPDEARHLGRMIDRGINAPWTSSMGRLFDGVAALLLGPVQAGYEGEPAARLEAVTPDEDVEPVELPFRTPTSGDPSIPRGDWRPLVLGLWRDAQAGCDVGRLAARFHRSVAEWGVAAASLTPGRAVALGGGCFQNRRLREWVARGLRARGRTVLAAARIPPGDGGLAAGQLAVTLARRSH